MVTKRREEEWGIYGCDLDLDAVEAVVDPNEPPLPGWIMTEKAFQFTKALTRGQKDLSGIVKKTFRGT